MANFSSTLGSFSNSNFSANVVESVNNGDVSSCEDDGLDVTFVVVGQQLQSHQRLQKALHLLKAPVQYAEKGPELVDLVSFDTMFVLGSFEGDTFQKLHKAGARIMGPTAVIQMAEKSKLLPKSTRPVFTLSMQNLVVCCTGIKLTEELAEVATLVHHMGGGIRKDFSSKVTHLVAKSTIYEKYKCAVSMGTPIMSIDWVYKTWEAREDVEATGIDDARMEYRLSPFVYSILSFYGFSKDEQRHMEEQTVANGGVCRDPGAPGCTHLVVDEHNVKNIPFDTERGLHIVKSEWFWGSIQMEACATEDVFRFEPAVQSTPRRCSRSANTPGSASKSGKRKFKEDLATLAQDESPLFAAKRRSRSTEMGHKSFSGSFLDATADTSGTPAVLQADMAKDSSKKPGQDQSKRQLTVCELLQTETNYVGILNTVLKLFKEEIEKPDQPGGPLLSATDIKLIFGKVPPIYEIHTSMLKELKDIVNNWSEERLIGDVIVKHADAMMTAYPPFVNFFEDTKNHVEHCDKSKPRFHAFLKKCQYRPECCRQTFNELLIRPVQRLPSIILLLKDILKRTEKKNPDHALLEKGITALDEVLKHINEAKGKTEGYQAMLKKINDIDNCPPNLCSAHRQYICKLDVIELTDTLSERGEHISLFLFSDYLEMCKRRVKVLSSKSPGTAYHGAGAGSKTPQKAYKHIEMMALNCVKKVIDIIETPECRNVFALVTKEVGKKEKLFSFMIVDDDAEKSEFLRTLSKHICNTTCRTDFENLLASREASSLQIDTADITKRNFNNRWKRVSRAFSFNKTPRRMRRAMSSMSSPFKQSRSGLAPTPGTGTLTPRHSNLTGLRLASTNDLSESTLDEQEETFNTPYSALNDPLNNNEDDGSATLSRRRETVAGVPSSASSDRRKTLSLWKHPYSTLKHTAMKRRSRRSEAIPPLPVFNDMDSPSTPMFPRKMSRKIATIGHAAGLKFA